MFKSVVFVATVFVVVQTQRPPYAGSPNRYPVVLPQYLDKVETSTGLSLDNRIDVSGASSSTQIPFRDPSYLPPEAAGSWDIIDKIKTWPREKQPFWYINWRPIQAHIGGKQPPTSIFPH